MLPGPPLNYIPPVFRPPSEWRSLLIQVTIGCSHNLCTYCDMYRSKVYRVRSIADIEGDLLKASDYYRSLGASPEKIFLCDGDALGAPQDILVETLDLIHVHFPNIKRVGLYATGMNILAKSADELKALAQRKCTMAYLGLESGDDQVLKMIVKGNTAAEMVEASLKIKSCGFKLSTIAMLGVGGEKYSEQHIVQTAKVLSATAPDYFSFLTTFTVPGTPYEKMVGRGLIKMLTSKKLLEEMYFILKLIKFRGSTSLFRANHVSNKHPVGGSMPGDREIILKTIARWIEQTPSGLFPERPDQM